MLDFNRYSIQSYAGSQDWFSSASIQDSGRSLSITGNGWKKIDFNYNVTANTVLEFQFKSSRAGEIHGIGFDSDDNLSRDRLFQLYGTQDWGISANSNDFPRYNPTAGDDGWVSYRIPVGQFYTGSMKYLTFANDHDIRVPTAESLFRDVRVFEADPITPTPPNDGSLDLSQYTFTSYAQQDRGPQAAISDGGSTVELQGNNWKKLAFPYTVTSDTVLEFQFRSDREGEIHGIGFDTDDRLSANRTFKLHGTQNWGIRDFDNYGDSSANTGGGTLGEWTTYRIPVGDFYTGEMAYLTLLNDHDVSNATAQSLFRNIRVYEESAQPQPPAIFEAGNLSGVQSLAGTLQGGGPDHAYRFSVDETTDFNAILEGLSSDANLLLRRSDGTSVDGVVLDQSNNSGATTELLAETLPAGDYVLQIEAAGNTNYDLILSGTPDVPDTSHQLNVSTATYLGGLGDDTAAAIEISPRHELIVAGNFSVSQRLSSSQAVLGATTSSAGQLVRLSASGREILSVTHLGSEINDMTVNAAGNIVVGGDFGVAVLNPTGEQVLWSQAIGDVERVAIANDGTVVSLSGKTVTTWSSSGQQLSQKTQGRAYVTDVEIHPETNLVYVTGFDNRKNANDGNNPVQVAYLNAFPANNLNNRLWQNWGFDGNSLALRKKDANGNDLRDSNGNFVYEYNHMADTRGYRVTIGGDGQLYFLGEVAGGNSVFRWNGQDLSTPTQIKYDAFNDPYNSKSPHQTYYARLDPTTGEVAQGQLAFARLNGDPKQGTNTFRVYRGAIDADENGNIYISAQGFSKIKDRDLNEINGRRVGAYRKSDPIALVVANDFQSRRLWTPFTEDIGRGRLQGIAAGHGRAAVLGSISQGSLITTNDAINPDPFNLNPLTNDPSGSLQDVYLATWGTDIEDGFVSLQAGGAGADVLAGGKSADLFVGGGDRDRLTGGGGADAFRYDAPSDGGDTITDFGGDDEILISAQGFGAGLVAGAPVSLGSTFRYSGGTLSFDADGAGGAGGVAIATLSGSPSLTANQIRIVA